MGIKSNFLKSAVVKHIMGITTYTKPTNVYLALYTSDPTVADTGTEVTGGSYARQQLSFGTESGGTVNSNTSETFTNMPACTVTHWGIRDASSGGNLLVFGEFEIPIPVAAAASFTIASGDIQINED